MNIKELEREEQRELSNRAKEHDKYQKYSEATDRILEDIGKRKQDLIDQLAVKLKKHFKVKVIVSIHKYRLDIRVANELLLHHSYNKTKFRQITSKLKDKIIEEYNEVFGEVSEEVQDHAIDALRYSQALAKYSNILSYQGLSPNKYIGRINNV